MGQYPAILQIQIERRTVGIIVADIFLGIKELIDQTYRIVKMPYYSNDPVLIAAMEDPENGPGLTPGAWSSEPLEIDMRGSGIIKGLYDALLGCREGDYVESYMTYNMAYGDINFSTIPKESPVAYFFTVNSVE